MIVNVFVVDFSLLAEVAWLHFSELLRLRVVDRGQHRLVKLFEFHLVSNVSLVYVTILQLLVTFLHILFPSRYDCKLRGQLNTDGNAVDIVHNSKVGFGLVES